MRRTRLSSDHDAITVDSEVVDHINEVEKLFTYEKSKYTLSHVLHTFFRAHPNKQNAYLCNCCQGTVNPKNKDFSEDSGGLKRLLKEHCLGTPHKKAREQQVLVGPGAFFIIYILLVNS